MLASTFFKVICALANRKIIAAVNESNARTSRTGWKNFMN